MPESNSTASKRLKFRLEVTIDDAGRVIAADLRVRDGATRESKSLGGWPVPAEGTDVGRLIEAIRREIEEAQQGQVKIARHVARAETEPTPRPRKGNRPGDYRD